MDTSPPLYKRLPRQAASILAKWLRHAYERRQLSQLDTRELSDVGISQGDRMAELSKPFWRD
ncbi:MULTISPECIES: DUF1127 domain-containing protein [unclassified Pseudomonas]|jgi:uncharacterized protein YjiS (DUF1127 family)|uniref:DUF1127 domain-containing protein n=1 Tax=unclassified Pseudomonas TaxID=196821 RepID=UPI0008D21FFF|nr:MULTISPECIES: DUF1127 domain-containing protein [unclassified Pseudomonas]PMV23743.1 DUF1127 domain-containing protein [Pseudomonas sp. FW305-3-2-15-C-TSA2]PMV30410.1 DUF1127 domain-containing protein [Pseudomonas sp. DP16D-L5]PMV40616.1 DUF1127 domain-containing protein [Pseudomonas sp. FW305-3-2-15-A-LB2]PMV47476.1 DUF1127 domain-containing protein [Pseudomonas sp. FW305-3-2-15-C-R2A1]PMV52896.1 DUF1127 domain-containing protein [Pseudomonas sp. FW305-3-2-15-C-LB1]